MDQQTEKFVYDFLKCMNVHKTAQDQCGALAPMKAEFQAALAKIRIIVK